jgi:hypothetical protein
MLATRQTANPAHQKSAVVAGGFLHFAEAGSKAYFKKATDE